jgi:hypothetical protein
MATLSDLLRQAAELQKRTWKAHEPIFVALGYSELPPEHVVDAVFKCVEDVALALGTDEERIRLFRARKAIEEKRAIIVPEEVPEEEQCVFCVRPFGAPGYDGRDCPECLSKGDRSDAQVRE